jgi:hypothetical protein
MVIGLYIYRRLSPLRVKGYPNPYMTDPRRKGGRGGEKKKVGYKMGGSEINGPV